MSALPPRTADTMSDAIAMSSPNGSMSGRAKKSAQDRLSLALFGEGGLKRELPPQPKESEVLRRSAQRLRDHAARGMRARAGLRDAAKLDAQATELESLGR